MHLHHFLGQSPLGFHRIHYAQWGARSARPPVICVHGLTRNGRDFDRLAEALQGETEVFCPDIAGRGLSAWLADPSLYGYPQYLADMTALIARTGAEQVDWVGTSMGGIIGMLLAAQPNTPIRRLVINDVGPFIPLAALQRIAGYVSMVPTFGTTLEVENHLRRIYAPFGVISDRDWKHLAAHSTRTLPDGKLALAHDPAIAKNFALLKQDVDFWPYYDRISVPTLLLRGEDSDILNAETAEAMTRRGPKAQLITFAKTGHAPALMDPAQVRAVTAFLRNL